MVMDSNKIRGIAAMLTVIVAVIMILSFDSNIQPETAVATAEEYPQYDSDSIAAHCREKFNAVFLNTAETLRSMKEPRNILEAETQLKLVNRLGTVEVKRVNSVCSNGRLAEANARVVVVGVVNEFFEHHSSVSMEDELLLLNEVPSNSISVAIDVKRRLAQKGCKIAQKGFMYICNE